MKACGATSILKTWGILICVHDRDCNYIVSLCGMYPFSISCFLFLLSPLPFDCRRNKTCGSSISSTKLTDKTWRRECFENVSLLYSSVCDGNVFELHSYPLSAATVYEVNLLAGHRGNMLISLPTNILVFVTGVIFLSGVTVHQAEIMRPSS